MELEKEIENIDSDIELDKLLSIIYKKKRQKIKWSWWWSWIKT